jgi:hypothetical protein
MGSTGVNRRNPAADETEDSDTTSLPIEGQGPGLDRGTAAPGDSLWLAATDACREDDTPAPPESNAESRNAREAIPSQAKGHEELDVDHPGS